jgi:hypothetical protein
MSYILDALRKAAEQRGSTTSVLFRPAPVQPGVARSWRMPWIVVGGLLALNVVVLAWTFRPSGAPDAPPTASESSASPGVAMAPSPVASATAPATAPAAPSAPSAALPSTAAAVAPAPSAAGPAVAPAQRPADLVPPSQAPVVGPTPKTVPSPSRQRATASRAVPTEPPAIGSERPSIPPTAVPERPGVPPTAVPERPAIPSAVEPPSSPRSRAERRAGVIQTMPPQPAAPSPSAKATGSRDALKLEVVSYSDTPAQRLVFISGRKYVEGDTTEGGFRVEHIKEDSVVLSDQGERFTLR